MKIYAFGGLGSGQELFSKIDFGSHELCFIPFESSDAKLSLKKYIHSLVNRIDASEPFMLMGFSFGGIIAQALAEKIHPTKLILISTFVKRSELPFMVQLAAYKMPYLYLPNTLYSSEHWLTKNVFRLLPKSTRQLLLKIMEKAGPELSKWAFKIALQWNGNKVRRYHRIHGKRDTIIKPGNLRSVTFLSNGGHFMLKSHFTEVNDYLNDLFSSQPLA